MKTYKGKVAPSGEGDKYVPLVAKIVLEDTHSVNQIAARAEVSQTTIRNWLSGKTKRPCRATMDNVLNSCGFRMGVLPMAFKPSEEVKPIKSFTWSQSKGDSK